MSKRNFHVVRLGKGWSVKSSGRVLSSHNTQENAAKSATIRAKRVKSEVVIHGRDGKIRSKDSYGNDPFPPRDKEH